MVKRVLQPFGRGDTYRALVFYVAQLVLGVAGLTLLVAGWPITLVFAITPLVIPLLIGLRGAVGLLARAEASVAGDLLGAQVNTPILSGGRGFWNRGLAVLRDPAFWKQQVHLLLAWPIALVPLTVLSLALELISLPVWYRWTDSTDVFGSRVGSFAETLPFFALGVGLLFGLAHLLGPMAALSRKLATALLGTDGPVAAGDRRPPEAGAHDRVFGGDERRRPARRDLGADHARRLLLADLAPAGPVARGRDPRRGHPRAREPGAGAARGGKQGAGDPDRRVGRDRGLSHRRLGDHDARILLAGVARPRAGSGRRPPRGRRLCGPLPSDRDPRGHAGGGGRRAGDGASAHRARPARRRPGAPRRARDEPRP